MRIFINILKLCLNGVFAVGVVAVTAIVAAMHYQGVLSGIALLNLENPPLEADALFGWLFEGITPDASFANWFALSITLLTLTTSVFFCKYATAIAELLVNFGEYGRLGQRSEYWRAMGGQAARLAIVSLPFAALIRGDVWLFQFRMIAGAMDLNDPAAAARGVLAPNALPRDWQQFATVDFLQHAGFWMYIGIAIAAPFALHFVFHGMGQTIAILGDQFAELFAGVRNSDLFQHYGYDSRGEPVYDAGTPIAFDVDGHPVAARGPQVQPESAAQATEPQAPNGAADTASHDRTGAAQHPEDNAEPEHLPVIGSEGETVTLAEALRKPDKYHVVTETRSVYARAWWDALHAEETGPNSEPYKEAAE